MHILFAPLTIVCARCFVNTSGCCLAHSVASGVGCASKWLPEALLWGHSGHWARDFVSIELPAIGKAQSLYDSCHATFLACFCFGEGENVSGSIDEKKLQRTENSGWPLWAAVLDYSHLLLFVAIGIVHVMLATQCKACPTMVCIRLADYAFMS